MSWRIIAVGVLCGVFFESVLDPARAGFYLVPIIISAVIYTLLPFTFALVNAGIAWLSGMILMILWALVITGGHFFSFTYLLHIILIMTSSFILLYAADQKK